MFENVSYSRFNDDETPDDTDDSASENEFDDSQYQDENYDPDYDSDGISRSLDDEERQQAQRFLSDGETRKNLEKVGISDLNKQFGYYQRYHRQHKEVAPTITEEHLKVLKRAGHNINDTEKMAQLFLKFHRRDEEYDD